MEDHLDYTIDLKLLFSTELSLNSKKKMLKKLQCHVCQKYLGHRSSLYKHLKLVHRIEPAQRLPILCKEPGCGQCFTFIEPFRKHLRCVHQFKIDVEKYVFSSMEEFQIWKSLTEKSDKVRFITSTGRRVTKNGKTYYFRCHRNGLYKPELKKRREMQSMDSPTHCISSMFVFEETDRITVEYCRTHYGHEIEEESKPFYKRPCDLAVSRYQARMKEEHLEDDPIDVSNLCVTSTTYNDYLSEYDKVKLFEIAGSMKHVLNNQQEVYYENDELQLIRIPIDVLELILNEYEAYDLDDSNDAPTFLKSIKLEQSSDTEEDEEREEEETIENSKESVPEMSWVMETVDDEDDVSPSDELSKELVKYDLAEEGSKIGTMDIISKRETIITQLQSLFSIVNEEEDYATLCELEQHLNKYVPIEFTELEEEDN